MSMKKTMGRIIPGEDSDSDYGNVENDEDPLEEEDDEEFMKRVKKTKAEKLSLVDHSKIREYPPFRKNFYIEVRNFTMSAEEVSAYRKQLELKIHGKDVPNQSNMASDRTVLQDARHYKEVEIISSVKCWNKPVEIQVGGRSVVNKDITQLVEIYQAWLSLPLLHGAKIHFNHGQSTISDFKSNVCNLLIATSIAARGLDVKELELVINYDVPNHYEDYVHRVGRTGRAGKKGCAITFISEDDARYAPDLLKLYNCRAVVPDDLKALADSFMAKVNQGLECYGTGYGGSGFKFNEEEDEVRRAAKKAQAKEYGFEGR
ncbi:hypothetical protein HAX54_028367 [Datura stramonium]|uniref:Helicase C-terminal domain-containing protein n=1 Tax=Datura stramonium TaxID=4076 RepID=A0ABS8V409_DATST|nr:hypothetical protein [Datura stramonium]